MGNKHGKNKHAAEKAGMAGGGYGPKPPPPSNMGPETVPDRYYQRTRRCSVSSEALDPNKAKLSTHPKTPAEKQAILHLLRNSDNFLFRNLKDVRMHMIADAMCKKTYVHTQNIEISLLVHGVYHLIAGLRRETRSSHKVVSVTISTSLWRATSRFLFCVTTKNRKDRSVWVRKWSRTGQESHSASSLSCTAII